VQEKDVSPLQNSQDLEGPELHAGAVVVANDESSDSSKHETDGDIAAQTAAGNLDADASQRPEDPMELTPERWRALSVSLSVSLRASAQTQRFIRSSPKMSGQSIS
jgi:hypothetical protein